MPMPRSSSHALIDLVPASMDSDLNVEDLAMDIGVPSSVLMDLGQGYEDLSLGTRVSCLASIESGSRGLRH